MYENTIMKESSTTTFFAKTKKTGFKNMGEYKRQVYTFY